MRRTLAVVSAALILGASLIGCGHTHHDITLTLIRHAQSTANAEHIVDTKVPGPNITAVGKQQAQDLITRLAGQHFDGIFVSDMVRTQQTAAPLADEMHIVPTVLSGLQEIAAAPEDEGRPEVMSHYAANPFPNRDVEKHFQARFTRAIRTIYATGDTHPAAFSHAGAITCWVKEHATGTELIDVPLPNTGIVVLVGNPIDGWKLIDWNGHRR